MVTTGSIDGPAMTLDGKIGNDAFSTGGPAEITRFTATSEDAKGGRWNRRLLPQPLYRYESTDPDVVDGALFAFVTSAGTDPEVLYPLTVVGTVFVTWTLVTGFFGQNFAWLVKHVESESDFLIFGIGGLVLPTLLLGTLFWVRRRDWF